MTELLNRRNMIERQSENWRPPSFHRVTTPIGRLVAAARRFLDLQAGSIWNDLAVLLPQSRGTVLDVGCGAQPYRHLLPPRVDLPGHRLLRGRRAISATRCPIPLIMKGIAGRSPTGSVDVVLCTETLEHVSEPSVFLAEAIRVLKHGGCLILTVPFSARWHYIPHDYWRFTPSGLERLLSAAGFGRHIAVFARGNALTVACYKAMALLLPLLIPQRRGRLIRLLLRACGLIVLPFVVILGGIGTLSLKGEGGDDCLGYTVVAEKGLSDAVPRS